MTYRAIATSGRVIVMEVTKNSKVGKVSVTYAPQQTCPPTCTWRNAGCYAEKGLVAHVATRKLNAAADGVDVVTLAEEEAAGIRGLSGKRALRLHVVGDVQTAEGAEILAGAAAEHSGKHGMPVWGYSHSWEVVPRAAWGNVAILASCETVEQVKAATEQGYATAIVVEEFPGVKRYNLGGVDVIPCPEQTGRSATCATCRLCWNDQGLRDRGVTIAFRKH